MGSKSIEMRKVRELLQLKFEQGLSAREAAHRVGMGKTAASEFIAGFSSCGLTLKEVLELSDAELNSILHLKKQTSNKKYQHLAEQFTYFEVELKRVGVTLQLLWKEYLEKTLDEVPSLLPIVSKSSGIRLKWFTVWTSKGTA